MDGRLSSLLEMTAMEFCWGILSNTRIHITRRDVDASIGSYSNNFSGIYSELVEDASGGYLLTRDIAHSHIFKNLLKFDI